MWEIILTGLAAIFVLIVLSGFFIPSTIAFKRSLTIDADKKLIFSYLDDLHNWKLWSAWSSENDAPIQFTYEGAEKGEGAIMKWKGKKLGAGKMEIKHTVPYKLLENEIMFNNSGFKLQSKFELTPASDATHVTWSMQGKIKRFGIAKIIGLLLPRWMGRDMETSLKILSMLCVKK